MEPHKALELLVLPVVRGEGGAVAFFVLLRLTTLGLGGLVAIFGGRDGPSAAFFAGPRRTSTARGDRAPLGAPGCRSPAPRTLPGLQSAGRGRQKVLGRLALQTGPFFG